MQAVQQMVGGFEIDLSFEDSKAFWFIIRSVYEDYVVQVQQKLQFLQSPCV